MIIYVLTESGSFKDDITPFHMHTAQGKSKGLMSMNDVMMCNGFHSHQISTQLNTYGKYNVEFTPEPSLKLSKRPQFIQIRPSQVHFGFFFLRRTGFLSSITLLAVFVLGEEFNH